MRKILPKKRKVKKEGTPRFLYLLAFLAFASWAGWTYLLFGVPPDEAITQILFLGLLFCASFFTLTFLFYEGSSLIDAKELPSLKLRRVGRRAFFIAAFICFSGAMILLEIANIFNLTVFGLILLLAEIQCSRNRSSPSKKEKTS